MNGFQRLNTRSAKVTGEGVMWIRQRYAEMWSYPRIREGLRDNFGVVLSIQQITRIAKGESFAQLPVLPTSREVDLTMHLNALGQREAPPPPESEIGASIAKLNAMIAKENAPRETVMDIMEGRLTRKYEMPNAPAVAVGLKGVPTLEELEAKERRIMGVESGKGLERLSHEAASQPAKVNAEKLLETLKDETQKTRD